MLRGTPARHTLVDTSAGYHELWVVVDRGSDQDTDVLYFEIIDDQETCGA